MYKYIKLARVVMIINMLFYVIYNSYFGWNEYPINEIEIFLDKTFYIVSIGIIILYIIPGLNTYEAFIKLIDENVEKNKNVK